MTVNANDEAPLTQRVVAVSKVVTIVPTYDTNAYAVGDLLFDATTIANAARFSGGGGVITGVNLIDSNDQGANALDILFFNTTVDGGTLNSAFALSDADALFYVGMVQIAAGNYVDAANNFIASVEANVPFSCAVTSLFAVGVLRSGTPTHTAGGVTINVYITQD